MKVLMMPDWREGNTYQSLLAQALEKQGVHVHFPHGYRRGFPLIRAILDLPEPPAVLHLHWPEPYLPGRNAVTYALFGLRLLADIAMVQARGVRVVWTVHNRGAHEGRFPSLESWVLKQLAARVDGVIVHSRSAARELTATWNLPAEKAVVIPHGHYRGVYGDPPPASEARHKLQLPLEGRVYLHFGKLRRYKGTEELLEAWPAHHAQHPADVLLIVGEPLDEAYSRELEAKASTGVRMIARRIPDADIPVYFAAADVAVLPFRNILTSGSLLLAMSFGKPVIAPRLEVLEEVAEPATGLFFHPTRETLAGSLARSAQADLVSIARRTAEACSRYGWERVAEITRSLYTQPPQAIAQPHGSRALLTILASVSWLLSSLRAA
ncbi:MAG: glycosyltransferase [Bryobacterales bacterium]|nr:glycosyltransferase [Bryobacterales bacterium]